MGRKMTMRPGPLAAVSSLPSLNTTPRSYSLSTCRQLKTYSARTTATISIGEISNGMIVLLGRCRIERFDLERQPTYIADANACAWWNRHRTRRAPNFAVQSYLPRCTGRHDGER